MEIEQLTEYTPCGGTHNHPSPTLTQPLISFLWNVYDCNCCSDYILCELEARYYTGQLMEFSTEIGILEKTWVLNCILPWVCSAFHGSSTSQCACSLWIKIFLLNSKQQSQFSHSLACLSQFFHHSFKMSKINSWLLLIHLYEYWERGKFVICQHFSWMYWAGVGGWECDLLRMGIVYLENKGGLLVHCSFISPGGPQAFVDPNTLSIVGWALKWENQNFPSFAFLKML